MLPIITTAVDIDQRYGRQMGANQPPQPIYRQQPHGMYVYTLYTRFFPQSQC